MFALRIQMDSERI